jgi:hypothetical protein
MSSAGEGVFTVRQSWISRQYALTSSSDRSSAPSIAGHERSRLVLAARFSEEKDAAHLLARFEHDDDLPGKAGVRPGTPVVECL